LTPHFKVTPESGDTAVARILAAFPGTDVTVTRASGPQLFSLGPEGSIEIPLTEPMSVLATQPVLVAQYEHSVHVSGSGFDIGDPFMMLIPPAEQFDTAYAFQSIIHPEFVNQHYINLVIPSGAEGSFLLDGAPLAGTTFAAIPGSRYLYAQVKVNAGSHYIRADSAFGLYVYGFGSATSYGYPGGMLFRKLVSDFEPPEISWEQRCSELKGVAFDSRITDTGIDSCFATSDTQNVLVTVDPFTPGADTVSYRAQLIDPYQDGIVGIRAIDSGGRSRSFVATIPGFTLRVANSTDVPAVLDTFVVLNTKQFCRTVSIRNYGKTKQKITQARLAENIPGASVDPSQFPLEITPGGFGTIQVCFANLADTIVSATLDIMGDCGSRRVAIIPIDNRVDTPAPSFAIDGDPCADEFTLTYFERFRSSGIASVEFDSTENCTVEKLVDPTKLPAQVVQVKLHRIDPRREIVFVVTLSDAAGNTIVERDTLGGFTVNILGRGGDTIGLRYDRDQTGDTLRPFQSGCDSVRITNYGSRPVTIGRVIMRGNRLYSIPPSQFPMVVPPKGSTRVMVCVEGRADDEISDTLVVVDECGHEEAVLLKNMVLPGDGAGSDICGDTLGFNTFAPTKRLFLTTPVPNPSGVAALVDIGLPNDDEVSIDIYSSAGDPVMSVVRAAPLRAGVSRVTFDVSKLESGAYICRMTTASGAVYLQKMIVRR
jgi:hypothetical protein